MSEQRFHVIGMTDDQSGTFSAEILQLMGRGKVFSGGKRHHEIVASLLPEDAVWIDITVPLDKVFSQYEAYAEIIVFASGDPLFFGFANTLKKRLPNAWMRVYPVFNSLQTLAHRLVLPYHDMRTVSLTGRPWQNLDEALIRGDKLIGALTDREKTPSRIAARMLEYGYDNYRMTVGVHLGNKQAEEVHTLPLDEVIGREFGFPNCLILEQIYQRERLFGIPESSFYLLNGREKMITKSPIRLQALSMLDLHQKHTFWDIGFCTGSVSIEAKLQFPHLQIHAFECRPEGETLINLNTRKFGTPGIEYHIGDFMELDLSDLPAPDAVFIGGHGGKLTEMLQKIDRYLLPGGCIVFNSVSENSLHIFREGIEAIDRRIDNEISITVDSYNPITIIKAI
ncbi:MULTISPECIES: precorrin-6y C5,15-methyltransferase (decarboxylating) subunit CbiE [Bacteroidales]|uniref:Precorrin-6y C5,15-methyltransferase (Decarboxylating) subunit CbiE n=1 Tax=Parabacteroides distasonis TaxID=823 RepID=A0A3L7ZV54_PARDI|nr:MULTISPECIES: precorrin-6y C5,15-methyltransferase (decarboxylating) subunit CbiE [Bacteroidales]NBH87906.1 precorrin-6y C5,15-methyltransferase (decarboxylating) subunit CbiE [Parabacteroides distasonis]RLT73910.1 precorrin-6y C5,15-methyltransferase (decarboxylating) subunit CbiE [Parabacteroides distasonis]TGY55013.1 precorrin-6y C5,15-methyltransferase (decarboxylating) subunit CbiE [Parabacteroides distasonis]